MSPSNGWSSGASTVGLVVLATLLFLGVFQANFVDPDVWHEMALIRQAWADGALPTRDTLAYTPTIEPSIHHEWGTGAILLGLGLTLGAPGLLLLKLVLTVGIAWATARAARTAGASAAIFCSVAPVAIFLSWYGFSTVRAQMFTLVFTALLMALLARDRLGARRWAWGWPIAQVVWLNLHAGFVVGLALLGAHALEQAARRRPVGHLVALLIGGALLTWVNPYGTTYLEFLWHSLRMPRPAIEEWRPAWEAPGLVIVVFVLSLVLAAYSASKLGWRRLPGVLPLLAAGWAGINHQRHLSIYAVVWLSVVPPWLEQTGIGTALRDAWERRAGRVRLACIVLAGLCLVSALVQRPWRVTLPARPGDHPSLTYPVGAVAWLQEVGFAGNLHVPFVVGAYVAWKLNPAVRVSLDGRYEVAYPPQALQANLDTYAARPGWERGLEAGSLTDAVLLPAGGPLAAAMPSLTGWTRAYQDDAYEVYLRPGRSLPPADRRGQVAVGTFP